MRRILLALAALTLLLCTTQCTSDRTAPVDTEYNEYVSAYTTGAIPRASDVRIVFTQDIPQGLLDSLPAASLLHLTPAIEGTCTYADQRTLLFHPKEEFRRDAQYTATVDVDHLFPGAHAFRFSFQTRPFTLSSTLKAFNVSDDDQYELVYMLLTGDAETDKAVESHVAPSMKADQEWFHAGNGMTHFLRVRVAPQEAGTLTLSTTADKALGLDAHPLTSTQLPSTSQFTVVSQCCKPGESNCLEVTFNKNLDPRQDVKGLVYVNGHEAQPVVEGNKVDLHLDLREGQEVEIVVSDKLRSRSGLTIGETQSFKLKVQTDKPQVEWVGDGSIVPLSDRITLPFRSVYMRGVRVAVFRIFGNRMGSLLQDSDIDDYGHLSYSGVPVAVTTFFIDDPTLDLSEWHTFALDLTDLVQFEPGAMYHVELRLDARLSAWPSDAFQRATPQEMAAEDARLMEEWTERFSDGGYYWDGCLWQDNDWYGSDHYDHDRHDPATLTYYNGRHIAKNLLATNIGLTALRGADQTLSVTALNLPDAQPMRGIQVEAYSMQQQLLSSAATDGEGIARLPYDPKRGKPTYVIARHGDDISYLRVKEDASLSTSTFDVSGTVIERGLKGFLYGERGVWRPGDTLHVAFMLNDRQHTLPADHPVTLRVTNPLGQEVQRLTRTEGAMGLYAFSIPTSADAPTGIWTAQVQVGGVTFAKNLRVEAIKPNRLKINLTLPRGNLVTGSNEAQLHTEWLNGSQASGLRYDITATVTETQTTWKGWKDYTFDDPTKTFDASEQQVATGEVSATGDASCLLNLQAGHTAPGMLRANLVTHVYEPSGEFSLDVAQALVAPYQHFVGIRSPQQQGQSHLDTDRDHTFHVASVDRDGKAVGNVKVKVDVYKVEWYWWWSSSRSDMAGYTASSHHQPVKSLDVITGADGKADFKLNMTEANWGTYLIMASDSASHHSAGTMAYFDWPWMTSRRASDDSKGATQLSITTDRQEYAPGDKVHISIPSSEGSRAIVSICNGSHILHLGTYPCQKERTEVVLEATDEMMPNVYVGVSLVQPYSQTLNDMPIRMYGFTPITVTSARSHLTPQIQCADEWRPESKCQVTVSERDGRPMAYTLAIVDEGLLDLTRFRTPDAWQTFNAREALGVRLWDLYGHVNGAYGGRIDQLFSVGGDDALMSGPKAIVNRFTPMVHFSGPYTLSKGQHRTHRIDVPNYNGRVRVMVVAGDGSAYGSAEHSTLVRRPLMLIGTLPRQIGRGDEMTVAATVFASKGLGDVKVSLRASSGLQVVGAAEQTVSFAEAGDRTVQFRVRQSGQQDQGTVRLTATAGSEKADYTAQVPIRTVSQTLSQTTSERLEAGATLERQLQLPGDGDYQLLLNASANQPLCLTHRLSQLIAYPHGCAEQVTSRAFPQLYLSDYAALSAEQQAEVEANVKRTLTRLASYQTSDGGMAYWPGGRQSDAWASAYVLHFLGEASARGYYVPDDLLRRLRTYVARQANAWTPKADGATAAYQLYVLACQQKAELGAMNRLGEHVDQLHMRATYLLSAAYAQIGRSDIGKQLLLVASQVSQEDGWWCSTDVTRLLAQMQYKGAGAEEAAEAVRRTLMADRWLSTSETSLSLIALTQYYQLNAVGKGLKFDASLDGKALADVSTDRYAWTSSQSIASNQTKLKVHNAGDAVMYLTLTTQGTATQSPVAALSNGLELSVRYTDSSNRPVDPASLTQSATFVATVTLRNASGRDLQHVALTHIVPAGWEILSAQPSGSVNYQDVRDDRVLSYVDRLKTGATETIRVNLSATYAGTYYLPSIHAEAMYDATVSGCTASSTCVVK